MLCRMFTRQGMGCCHAVEGDHIPTILERERYCQRGGEGCPILAAYEARGAPLGLDDYLDTWSGPPNETERAAL